MFELYEKLAQFNNYVFTASSHHYTYKKLPVKQSVTQFVDNFCAKFDKDYWAEYKAKQQHVSKEEILKQWADKAEASSIVGTEFHRYMENRLANKIETIPSYNEQIDLRLSKLITIGDMFINENKLIPIKSEVVVGIEDIIAGQIDQLFYNKEENELQIFDYKTNKDIRFWNTKEKMLAEFNDLDCCEYNTYSLQLSTYKYILQQNGIDVGKMFLVWINENNNKPVIYQCKDFSDRVKNLL